MVEENFKIIKSSRHQKIIGDYGENLICNWLSRCGFEVVMVDHTGIDVIAYRPDVGRLGISVKSRTRVAGKEKATVKIFSYDKNKVKDEREKIQKACEAFACEPWLAIYVETTDYADLYLTSLKNIEDKYGGKDISEINNWKMKDKDRKLYENDPMIKHIRVEFQKKNWNW